MDPITFTNPLQQMVNSLDDQSQVTTSAQQTVSDHNTPKEPEDPKSASVKKRNDDFRARIDLCKVYRRKLVANWTVSIDYRRGKPFVSQTDDDQVAVNLDWVLTKEKVAALFGQTPQVRISHSPESLKEPWLGTYERSLNDCAREAGIESVIFECLPDCINASGIGVAIVSYEALQENRDVPKSDMSMLSKEQHDEYSQSQTIDGAPVEMESVPAPVDHRYIIQRISPADLLWPINFTGSDMNNAPWLGRSGKLTWADAAQKFSLKDSDKASIVGDDKTQMDRLSHDVEKDKIQADEMVGFDEVFFREFQYDPDAKSFSTIHHLVFVAGKEIPVIDEPWKGQKIGQDGTVSGALRYPIQTLTLSYLTDEAIPPSDSAVGRPQINELNRGRTQQVQQRQRSLPVRWFDVNRVDPAIQQGLMRGTWQAMIPVQGDGTRVIGEVAKASMPVENFKFDDVAKADLKEQWSLGVAAETNQEKKNDVSQNSSPFNTQIGVERARVSSFFVRLAEILGGLMCIYEDPAIFGEGFDPSFSRVLKYAVLADSTVLLDAGQRLARLNQFIDLYAKSGWVNIEPAIREVATLVGLDPNTVVKAPDPKPPVEPNISLRLTGIEDLLNPMALAMLMKSGQAPDAQLIEQAKALIQQAVVPPQPSADPSGGSDPSGQLGGGMAPGGAPQGATQGAPPLGPPLPAPQAGPPPGTPPPGPAAPTPGNANPQWTKMPKITKRSRSNQS